MPLARALKEEQSPRPAAAQCCHLCVCKTHGKYLEITQPLREKRVLWSRAVGGREGTPLRPCFLLPRWLPFEAQGCGQIWPGSGHSALRQRPDLQLQRGSQRWAGRTS